MENERSIEYYDSRVRDVKLEDITSSEYNARALRKLRDNDPDKSWISFTDDANLDVYDVLIRDNDDMGWLGYLIGRNSQLERLAIYPCLEDIDESRIEALFQGISLNRSISKLIIFAKWEDFYLHHLSNFFRSNKNLTEITLLTCSDIGLETVRNLAVDLRDMSLESFRIARLCFDSDTYTFTDEGAVTAEVMAALSTHPKLEHLDLRVCNLDRSACLALGRLSSLKELKIIDSDIDTEGLKALACNFRCLESLELSHMSVDIEKEVVALSSGFLSLKKLKLINSIGDDALQHLVATMANDTALEVLDLSRNTSITAKGLSSLASLLQSDKCCVRELVLRDMHIGDDGVAALAEALAGNKSLQRLDFSDLFSMTAQVEIGISATGWSAFTRLLCDTSSVNNTYLSNHTLERCDISHAERMESFDLGYYLSMNKNKNKQHIAMHKILSSHLDFDLKPLFQWQLKFLPLIVAWFKTTRAKCPVWIESIDSLQRREISAIYQFVRGLPMVTVAGWRNLNMTGSESKKRKLDHL